MPTLAMTVEVRNLPETTARLDRLATALVGGYDPALVEIGELGATYFGGVAFDSHGMEFGQPWDELAASTRADKTKHWPGRPDMVRSGTLQNSFAYEVIDGSAVRLYNEAPWFVYHQSAAERHKLPRRIMIGITASFEILAREAIEKQTRAIISEVMR